MILSDKKLSKITIIVLLGTALLLSIGYASLAHVLAFDTEDSFGIRFSNVEEVNASSNNVISSVNYENSSVTFMTNFRKSGSITYKFTIQNIGNVDAKLGSINLYPENSQNIKIYLNNIEVNDGLYVGQYRTFTATIEFTQTDKQPLDQEVKIDLNYIQK